MSVGLPCRECGGRCCKLVPFTIGEYKAVRKRIPSGSEIEDVEFLEGSLPGVPAGNPGKVILNPHGQHGSNTCAFITIDGCSIYADRPQVCRIYGEDTTNPCEYLHPGQSRPIWLLGPEKLLRRN